MKPEQLKQLKRKMAQQRQRTAELRETPQRYAPRFLFAPDSTIVSSYIENAYPDVQERLVYLDALINGIS